MSAIKLCRPILSTLLVAGFFLAVPVQSHASQAPVALCGGGEKKKDVKRPTGDDKKPANPACNGDCDGKKNKKKDVKKPQDGKQPAPASASELCGGGKKKKDVKRPSDDKKRPINPV